MSVIHIIEDQMFSQWELLVRIVIASCLGGAIGFERRSRSKDVGMRTHAIVALGAALIMVVSKYGFSDIPNYDAARVAAQVVSGVGFLGAGIIFVRDNAISGLTTAAGIWATAGVGLGMGSGLYFISIVATLLIILVQILLHKIGFLAKEAYRDSIKLILINADDVIQNIENQIKKEKVEITGMKVNKTSDTEIKLDLDVIYPAGYKKIKLINSLAKRKDITMIKG